MESSHFFFFHRLAVDYGIEGLVKEPPDPDHAVALNVPPITNAILSNKLASLSDLQGCLGLEDAYNVLESASVHAFNTNITHQKEIKKNEKR